jgi:DNA-binding MarR family transcriptional regulator
MHMPRANLGTREGEAVALREIDRLLRQIHDYRRSFPRTGYCGLTPLCLQVLLLLRQRGEMAVCDIATALFSARPTVSNAVALLHQKGLVVQSGDSRDRRLRYQCLSVLGASVIDDFVAMTLGGEAPGA